MVRCITRLLSGVALLIALVASEGCYYHHQNGGYHRDFASYTPERVSGFRDHFRRNDVDVDYYHLECR